MSPANPSSPWMGLIQAVVFYILWVIVIGHLSGLWDWMGYILIYSIALDVYYSFTTKKGSRGR